MANEQPQWAAAKVRQTFLDYFKERGHTFGRTRTEDAVEEEEEEAN
jgi:alanyl-tRNA synthetase